ncbi:hypothetical protein N7508_007939 [Penicillium antarcticum]|uniref:uncharacterized protein n=1 Tax=Penicillium antarcticum TaxID=416450 RepID=UPI0023913E12|nr:uncharacterized protein N7508_007939 [Penicillium antarcticum]KAJ5297690.1 hypothetical protein N7508_007939 [Penicillium antarcticum]
MPPSTVFSYWRRDHRRSLISPALPAGSPSSKGTGPNNGSPISSPPQLPQIPDTPTLTTPFGHPSQDAPPLIESPLDIDTSKLNITSSAAPLSSSLTLAVPSPSYDSQNRPHSSPGEWEDETFTSQANDSQVSVSGLRSDQGDGESNFKSNSPFRRSFGKQKRSPTAGPGSGHFRFRASPDNSPADKQNMPQKEFKLESAAVRRVGDRDVSAENASTHHKSGKAMLHLLNPMSLLARRRSSQIVSSKTEEPKLNNRHVPAMPDDYDPRIRGNIVHDFSAPRPRKNVSAQQDGQEPPPSQIPGQPKGGRWNDQTKRHSDHSPVFKEHFEDQNVLQVENKGYLQSSLLTNQSQPGYEKSLPAFARNLPSHLPEEVNEPEEQQPEPESPAPLRNPPKALSPKEYQYQGTADEDTIPHVPFNPSGLPRHLKSNASRFSFDMSGVESSVQEKLLEEKHKAKEAARKVEDGYFDDFDDDFDNDMMDDMDGLEEKIPGVNVDADDDDFDDLSLSRNINGELKSWAIPGLSPVVASPITPAPPGVTGNSGYISGQYEVPPVDAQYTQDQTQEQPLPVASSDAPLANPQVPAANTQQPLGLDEDDLYFDDGEFGDLNNDDQDGGFDESIFDDETSHLYERKPVAPLAANSQIPTASNPLPPILDEDDMYFDDGEFGDLNINDQDGGFDESIFDDETSHLYERKPKAPPPAETTVSGDDSSPVKESTGTDTGDPGLRHMPSVASDYRKGSIKRGPLGEPIPNLGPARAHGGVLTELNLDILHNALAFAANEAAQNSRLDRTISMSERSQGQDSIAHTAQTVDSQPGLVSDDSRLSQGADPMAFEDVFDDDTNYDDMDDTYFDDAIVAAANAEALENDDEGFYGQEFGFYAQADSTCNTELTNGGYFGPRRVEGVTRSHSSRGKFQEPSLTPITERSEWSTRNSMISLKAHGATSNPSLASPGLAQLVDMGNIDDELSLSALMKLRRGAWGGSNGSLRSSAGSPPPQHPISSSNRASFTGASEASPIPFSPDEGPPSAVGYFHDDGQVRTASPLALSDGPADLPVSEFTGRAAFADDADESRISGAL